MAERLPLPTAPESWAMFLDVDGTLLEHAERPDAVRVDASLGALLARLERATGGALALISGRAVADLDALFAPLELAAAGQHGLERRDASGRLHLHPFPVPALRRAAARLAEFAARHAGIFFEDKGRNLALHYRQAPQLAETVRGAASAVAAELGAEFELQAGKLVIEIKPGGRDKGLAIEEFMREPPFRGRTPVFVGDDLTDEFGFGVINKLGGHSIKVGIGPSCARWRLAGAAEVRDWLERCAAAQLSEGH